MVQERLNRSSIMPTTPKGADIITGVTEVTDDPEEEAARNELLAALRLNARMSTLCTPNHKSCSPPELIEYTIPFTDIQEQLISDHGATLRNLVYVLEPFKPSSAFDDYSQVEFQRYLSQKYLNNNTADTIKTGMVYWVPTRELFKALHDDDGIIFQKETVGSQKSASGKRLIDRLYLILDGKLPDCISKAIHLKLCQVRQENRDTQVEYYTPLTVINRFFVAAEGDDFQSLVTKTTKYILQLPQEVYAPAPHQRWMIHARKEAAMQCCQQMGFKFSEQKEWRDLVQQIPRADCLGHRELARKMLTGNLTTKEVTSWNLQLEVITMEIVIPESFAGKKLNGIKPADTPEPVMPSKARKLDKSHCEIGRQHVREMMKTPCEITPEWTINMRWPHLNRANHYPSQQAKNQFINITCIITIDVPDSDDSVALIQEVLELTNEDPGCGEPVLVWMDQLVDSVNQLPLASSEPNSADTPQVSTAEKDNADIILKCIRKNYPKGGTIDIEGTHDMYDTPRSQLTMREAAARGERSLAVLFPHAINYHELEELEQLTQLRNQASSNLKLRAMKEIPNGQNSYGPFTTSCRCPLLDPHAGLTGVENGELLKKALITAIDDTIKQSWMPPKVSSCSSRRLQDWNNMCSFKRIAQHTINWRVVYEEQTNDIFNTRHYSCTANICFNGLQLNLADKMKSREPCIITPRGNGFRVFDFPMEPEVIQNPRKMFQLSDDEEGVPPDVTNSFECSHGWVLLPSAFAHPDHWMIYVIFRCQQGVWMIYFEIQPQQDAGICSRMYCEASLYRYEEGREQSP